MARPPSTQPTEVELEILKILWDIGPAGLGQVHQAMNEHRPVAMTTVATMLKTMLSKSLIRRDEGAKGYTYAAEVTREAAATGMIGRLLNHVFEGSAQRLVAHLIREGTLDDRERKEVLDLLNRAEADQPAEKQPKKGGRR
jgi:predicted transcriptional regulator